MVSRRKLSAMDELKFDVTTTVNSIRNIVKTEKRGLRIENSEN